MVCEVRRQYARSLGGRVGTRRSSAWASISSDGDRRPRGCTLLHYAAGHEDRDRVNVRRDQGRLMSTWSKRRPAAMRRCAASDGASRSAVQPLYSVAKRPTVTQQPFDRPHVDSRPEPRTFTSVGQTLKPDREFAVALQINGHRHPAAVLQDENGDGPPPARLRAAGDDIRPREPACRQERQRHFDPISVESDSTAADSDPVGKEAGKRSAGVRKPLKRRQPMADGAYHRLEQREGKHAADYHSENRCRRLDGPGIHADDDRCALVRERTPTVAARRHAVAPRSILSRALDESSLHPVRSTSLASTDRSSVRTRRAR